jgi:hypothetical protein
MTPRSYNIMKVIFPYVNENLIIYFPYPRATMRDYIRIFSDMKISIYFPPSWKISLGTCDGLSVFKHMPQRSSFGVGIYMTRTYSSEEVSISTGVCREASVSFMGSP